MGNIVWTGINVIAILVVIFLKKISSIMGDLAKGIKSLKKVCRMTILRKQ